MNILVIGGGGREHTLCWALKKSRHTDTLFCIPGNAGIAEIATCASVRVADKQAIVQFAQEQNVKLVVIGPEAPLVEGLGDLLRKAGIRVFGPSTSAARIEGSKGFAKDFMRTHNIPTASYRVFNEANKAIEFAQSSEAPLVVKADGLAAGKGVIIPRSIEDTAAAIQKIMVERAFGEAGARVILEQCLTGQEVSVMAFADGRDYATMVAARDHKRIFDHDRGPNTGGMGAYAPTRIIDEELMIQIEETVIEPTITGLHSEGHPFVGCLYAGLMIADDGPRVLEFNCRFGDPETQVVLPLLKTDLVEIMMSCVDGELDLEKIEWSDQIAVCVILASRGYPGKYDKGYPIAGLEAANGTDTLIFHAGTAKNNGEVVTAGGRVLGITALGTSYENAVARAYNVVDKVRFKGMQYRNDIGFKAGVDRKIRQPSSSKRYSRRRKR